MSQGNDVSIRLGLDNTENFKSVFRELGETGEKALLKIEQAAARPSQAFQRLASSLDPAYAAQTKFERGVTTLNRELDKGSISSDTHAKMMSRLSNVMTVTANGTSRAGGIIQQASFQIADIAAVAAAGGNAFAAAGTQLGQFLGFLGPIGAVAGAGVTILGLLATKMLDVGSASEETKYAAERYKEGLDSLLSIEKEYNEVLRERQGLEKTDRLKTLKSRVIETDYAVSSAANEKEGLWSGVWGHFKKSIGLSPARSKLDQAYGASDIARSDLSYSIDLEEATDKAKAEIESNKQAAEAQERKNKLLEDERVKYNQARQAMDDHLRSLENQRTAVGLSERDQFIFNETLRDEKNALALSEVERQQYVDKIREAAGALYDLKKAQKDQDLAEKEAAREREKNLRELTQAVDHTTDKITDAFVNAWDGSKSAAEVFKSFVLNMFKEIAANSIIRPVIRPLVEGVLGDGKSDSGLWGGISSIFGSIFHDGGIAGGPAPSRAVPASVFAGAPRYHGGGIAGLAPDEVPAILQRGEPVFPRGTKFMNDISVNVINNAGAEVSAQRKVSGGTVTIDVLVDRALEKKIGQRGSGSNKAIRQTFGASERLVRR